MTILTREQILAAVARPLATEHVDVPEWGGAVTVRELTGEERDAFENGFFSGRGKDRKENFDNMRARLVALSVVDEAGTPVFKADQVAILGKSGVRVLDRLYDVARRLSGIGEADVEEMVGNSGAGQSAGNGSGSHGSTASP